MITPLFLHLHSPKLLEKKGNKMQSLEEGYFSIHGEGADIVFQAITADHIDYNTPTPVLMISDWEEYTPDNPYVFNTWRVDSYENVRHGHDGYQLLPDGRIYTYDPFDSDRSNRWHEGETDGLLRVSCERGEMERPRDFQEWRVTLKPIDGGIQSADDIYMNIAPVSGYQDSISVEQKLSSNNYQRSVGNSRYFITAHQGKYYGGLRVRYRPHFRKEQCSISISYKVNMDGTRNLAVKPEEKWN